MEYIGWFNHDRLHESLGDVPPVEFETAHKAAISPIRSQAPFALRASDRPRSPRPSASMDKEASAPLDSRAAGDTLRSAYGLAALHAGEPHPDTVLITTTKTP